MIFDNDFQIDIKAILALFLGGSVIACTSDDPAATVSVPAVTVAAPVTATKVTFTKIVSAPLTTASLAWEAITVTDINGDGYKDLILANGPAGGARNEILSTDPKTIIALNNGLNTITQLNASNLSSTGWVNDWVVLPSSTGNPYIIGVDHGREIAYDPKYWSTLKVFQYDNGVIADRTAVPVGNTIGFYHNASSYGDLNNDGLMDFVTAEMGNESFSIFYGDRDTIFREAAVDPLYNEWGSSKYVGQTGAALVLDLKNDGQQDFILLPYSHTDKYGSKTDGIYAEAFNYSNGQLESVTKFDARTPVKLPDDWGYSYAQVLDLNKDGLQDFVALAEDPNSSSNGQRAFVTFMQKTDGTFDVFSSMSTTLVDSKQSVMNWAGGSNIWSEHKFELIDVDGDKNLDLFWGAWFNGKPSDLPNSVFYGDGTGHFARNETLTAELFKDVTWEGTARTHMTDFNNDGLGDLLVLQDYNNLITPIIFVNNGLVI